MDIPSLSLANSSVPVELLASLRSLAARRVVEVWGADPSLCHAVLAEALEIRTLSTGERTPGGLLLCLQPDAVEFFLKQRTTTAALAAGGIVVAWSRTAVPRPDTGAAYSMHYLHRPLSGVLLRDPQFSRSRIVALHREGIEVEQALHLLLWSNVPLPALRPGLYEAGAVPTLALPAPMPAGPFRPALVRNARAVALAARLLAVEDCTVALRGEIMHLKTQLAGQSSPTQQSHFDVPRTRHPWALAETPTRSTETLLRYDRRPDDLVVLEAQQGVAFMETYGLLSKIPSFADAVAALNRMPRSLLLDNESPVVSIIVPVYGQLPYTLNCLDSLLRHASHFSAEIIVVDDCSPDSVTQQFVPQVAGVRYHRQANNGGFIQSCNTGAKIARGAYVVMLNSDTRVVERWLDEIIGSFTYFPRAGLVGSKMLYPDGSLQEAGGILWRDGAAWNYGRDDDPNRPQYCYARQVDYISGCSIAMRTAFWRELGGFDMHYTPAYAEDADLCQRVAERGLEVWFQPASRVVHYEGKTSGTSTTGGIKAYQVINLKKLFLRWRQRFEHYRRNGEAPFFEKERYVRKRILFVDAVTPTPDQDAGSVQTMLGLRAAQAAGYKVHFVPEDNWLFEPSYTPRMLREGIECAYAPYNLGFENYIRLYGWLFDVIVVYRVNIMQKCLSFLQKYAPDALHIFHLADLHYLRAERQALLDGDQDALEAALALKDKELEIIRQADCVITHSTAEADILATEAPKAPVNVWPLMTEFAGTRIGFEARHDVCFLGGYRHSPNIDAVEFFIREILPFIHAVRPNVRFIVAGANPTPEIVNLADDKVVVTGMVNDLAEVFDTVRVFVCPLRVGAGAKGKVLSALSHGLPVVSTSIGVEGAGLLEDKHVLVADTPGDFATAVLRLYDDPELWQSLSKAGQMLVRDEFSLDMGVRKLAETIEKGYRNRLGLPQA